MTVRSNKQFFSTQREVIPPVGLLHPNPVPTTKTSLFLHPSPAPTTTTNLFEAPLRPLAGHPLQAQPMVQVQPILRKEAAPLNMAGFIAPTAALIQLPSGNRAIPRPTYLKTSTLWSPLRLIVLPLIYILPRRCHAWFFAIDQDGDGTLSAEELRTHFVSDLLTEFGSTIVQAARS